MLDDLRVGGWQARRDDGEEFCDASPELASATLSPWREFARQCAERGRRIVAASVFCGDHYARLGASGGTLTCGQQVHARMDVGGSWRQAWYWWVRRDEETRALWGICGIDGSWIIETPPGQQACPDPRTVA